MRTELCTHLGIQLPIVLAPMGGAVGPQLTAAVSNAGGLGMIPLWYLDPETVRASIRTVRDLTNKPFGVNLNLNWPQEDRLAVCLDEGVSIISTFWGDPSAYVQRAHQAGATVFHTAGSAEEARRAADAGADIIVAQGWEAGGHVRGTVATLRLSRLLSMRSRLCRLSPPAASPMGADLRLRLPSVRRRPGSARDSSPARRRRSTRAIVNASSVRAKTIHTIAGRSTTSAGLTRRTASSATRPWKHGRRQGRLLRVHGLAKATLLRHRRLPVTQHATALPHRSLT